MSTMKNNDHAFHIFKKREMRSNFTPFGVLVVLLTFLFVQITSSEHFCFVFDVTKGMS